MNIKDFTDAELKDIHDMMQFTWDYIGMDMLQCVADSEGKHRDRVSMPKSHVIEVVLDANYMEMDAARSPEEKELLKKFRQLEYKDQIKVAKQTFTAARYGM